MIQALNWGRATPDTTQCDLHEPCPLWNKPHPGTRKWSFTQQRPLKPRSKVTSSVNCSNTTGQLNNFVQSTVLSAEKIELKKTAGNQYPTSGSS